MTGPVRLEGGLRKLAFALLRLSGAPLVLRHTLQRHRLTILLFHQQTPELFERTAQVLKRRYSVIALADALDALEAGSFSALPKRPLAITFDDGRASNAALIPVLRRHGIRPTAFVTTGLVGTRRHFWWAHLSPEQLVGMQRMTDAERIAALEAEGLGPLREYDEPQACSREELVALSAVADIQPHTRSHPVLTRCTPEQVRDEIAGSATDVESLTGTRPKVFAYPNGELSDDVVAAVTGSGLRFALTTEPVLVTENSDPLRLGRIFVRDTAGASELIVFASGLQGMLGRLIRRHRA